MPLPSRHQGIASGCSLCRYNLDILHAHIPGPVKSTRTIHNGNLGPVLADASEVAMNIEHRFLSKAFHHQEIDIVRYQVYLCM